MVPYEIALSLAPWMMGFVLATLFFTVWSRERRFDRDMKRREFDAQEARAQEEARRRANDREEAQYQHYLKKREEEEKAIRKQAGDGSGGYIVLDLPNAQRGLFTDLLKGFEEYARLKGYSVSFSVDSTFNDHIAFKFTITDSEVIVGNDRIRKDLKEYIEKISQGNSLDDLPQVISIEEHELLIATLKNRISFLQHNYNLAKVSADFYEGLIRRASAQQFLPSPSIVVQTGGAYHAPNYTALNSPQALLGNNNVAENTIRIGDTYKDRKLQIDHLVALLAELRTEIANDDRDEVTRSISNVREELEQQEKPDAARVSSWLQRAKETIQLGSFSYQTVQAAKELFRLFGIG